MVLRVDKEKGYIDLSKRRVSPEDVAVCEERFSKSKMVHSIMRHVAETTGQDVEELYKCIAWPLYRAYGHAFDAFKVFPVPCHAHRMHLQSAALLARPSSRWTSALESRYVMVVAQHQCLDEDLDDTALAYLSKSTALWPEILICCADDGVRSRRSLAEAAE